MRKHDMTIADIIEQEEDGRLEAIADDVICDRCGETYDDQNGCPCGRISPAKYPLSFDPYSARGSLVQGRSRVATVDCPTA